MSSVVARGRRGAPIAAGALVFVMGIAACGQGSSSARNPRRASLEAIVTHEQAYLGRTIRTTGTVRSDASPSHPLHFWIEDAAANRVGLEPPRTASRLVGRIVEVVGALRFAPGFGRSLRVATVRPLDGACQIAAVCK